MLLRRNTTMSLFDASPIDWFVLEGGGVFSTRAQLCALRMDA
jgi:hypothetical protein